MGDAGMIRRAWQLLMRRSDISRAVDDELSFHLETTVEALKAEGQDESAARRKAERLFGLATCLSRQHRHNSSEPFDNEESFLSGCLSGVAYYSLPLLK